MERNVFISTLQIKKILSDFPKDIRDKTMAQICWTKITFYRIMLPSRFTGTEIFSEKNII